MRYEFDWDPVKAATNRVKHDVTFDEAMTVFADPLALSIPDDDHSDVEDRWVTVGMSRSPRLLLVVHTHIEVTDDVVAIRIIMARKPTRTEVRQYENNPAT